MLCIRKWKQPIASVFPVFSYSVLRGGGYHRKFCEKQAYFGFRLRRGIVQSPLTDLEALRIVPRNFAGLDHNVDSFSTMAGAMLGQGREMDIENAIKECRLDDAWKLYEQCVQVEGIPCKSVLNRLLISSSESLDVQWLDKCLGFIEYISKEGKESLLETEPMLYLALSLCQCQLVAPASTILRKIVKMGRVPPDAAWSAILVHMSETPAGANLASDLILEMDNLSANGKTASIAMKPNMTALNSVLGGCLLFRMMRKAEKLLDMMARLGVKMDATFLITTAHIYERNGQSEELKKLQTYVDVGYNFSESQFRQFHSCLLSCYLKHGDLVSSSNIVLKMFWSAKKARISIATAALDLKEGEAFYSGCASQRSSSNAGSISKENTRQDRFTVITFEDFFKDRNFLKLDFEAKEILYAMLAKLQSLYPSAIPEHRIFQSTETLFAELVKAYLKAGKTRELADFIIKAEKENCSASGDNSVLYHVINSCISLGRLDQARNLLDELHSAGVRTSASVFSTLIRAYPNQNFGGEIMALFQDAQKAGMQLALKPYEALVETSVPQRDTQGSPNLYKQMKNAKTYRDGHRDFDMLVNGCLKGDGEAGIMGKLLREIKEEQLKDSGIHDWNNILHFFSKKRLMQDAERALKKLRTLGHTPNAQTFHSMVTGYAAVGGKYAEVTELWSEMKTLASSASMKFDQELLDSLLYTFVRGGFFLLANEVVDMMEKRDMFVDKYKYRTLYLKYHRTLYKGKAPKIQTEVQLKRREATLKFKKWLGLH